MHTLLIITAISLLSAETPKQVRIALSLTPYQKTATVTKKGHKYQLGKTEKYTLRADLDRTNHYYFKNWHVISKPLYWSKQTAQYKTEITVLQRLGNNNEIEEMVGKIIAEGTLKTYQNLYVLQNFQKKTFPDNSGKPRLRIASGFNMLPSKKAM